MNTFMQSKVASILMALVGIWLLASPLVITITGPALISMMAVGGLFVLTGIVQFFWENTLPSWVAGLAAIWLVISTVVFSLTGAALWSQVIAAGVAILLAIWDGAEVDTLVHAHSHA